MTNTTTSADTFTIQGAPLPPWCPTCGACPTCGRRDVAVAPVWPWPVGPSVNPYMPPTVVPIGPHFGPTWVIDYGQYTVDGSPLISCGTVTS